MTDYLKQMLRQPVFLYNRLLINLFHSKNVENAPLFGAVKIGFFYQLAH